MASIYGDYVKQSRLRLDYSYTQNISQNKTTINLSLVAEKPAGMGTHSNNYGTSYYDANFIPSGQEPHINWTWGNTTEYTVASGTFDVYHNSDGTASVELYGYWNTGLTSSSVVGEVLTAKGTITLPTIPRYAEITSFTVSNIAGNSGITSVKYSYTTDSDCDYAWYSINGGSTWKTLSSNNIVSGLSPKTSYNFKLRVRRTDSQLTTDSDTVTKSTYDIARISSASNFTLGSSASVVITNPANATASLRVKVGSTQILSKAPTIGTNTIQFTDTQLDNIYKKFGNGNTVTITHELITNGVSVWTVTKAVTCTLKGNQKTGHIRVNGAWKRTKKWIRVNGAWKRCVRWIRVNGTWKRCI